jgi:histidine triad (HIT) family protein
MKSDPNCIFCRIIRGEVQATYVDRRPFAVVIRDTNPQAPDHVLIVPTDHITSLGECKDGELLGQLLLLAHEAARKVMIDHGGYRVVLNSGDHGGQTVPHLHLHLLGGRRMRWPPG